MCSEYFLKRRSLAGDDLDEFKEKSGADSVKIINIKNSGEIYELPENDPEDNPILNQAYDVMGTRLRMEDYPVGEIMCVKTYIVSGIEVPEERKVFAVPSESVPDEETGMLAEELKRALGKDPRTEGFDFMIEIVGEDAFEIHYEE